MNHSPEEPGQEPLLEPLSPEEEKLVKEGLADYKAGRVVSEQELREAIKDSRRQWSKKDSKTA